MQKLNVLTSEQLEHLYELAKTAAQQAGQYIENFNRKDLKIDIKEAGNSLASQVVTQVDLACEQIIYDILKPSCVQYNIAFLGEESASQYLVNEHPRLSETFFWCVDPLDGTLPFTENSHGYAVSIALLNRAGQPILAAVYDPVEQTLYQTISNQADSAISTSLLKQQKTWQPKLTKREKHKNEFSLYIDRSFTSLAVFPDVLVLLQKSMKKLGYGKVRVFHHAGAVMNAIKVIENSPSCYFKFPKEKPGGGSIWDFAATCALMHTAQGWVSDIYGKPLRLNEPDSLFMNHRGVLFASDKHIANEIMQIFKALNSD